MTWVLWELPIDLFRTIHTNFPKDGVLLLITRRATDFSDGDKKPRLDREKPERHLNRFCT